MSVNIIKEEDFYYLSCDGRIDDEALANKINLIRSTLQRIMVQYGATMIKGECLFRNINDIEIFKEWYESRRLVAVMVEEISDHGPYPDVDIDTKIPTPKEVQEYLERKWSKK